MPPYTRPAKDILDEIPPIRIRLAKVIQSLNLNREKGVGRDEISIMYKALIDERTGEAVEHLYAAMEILAKICPPTDREIHIMAAPWITEEGEVDMSVLPGKSGDDDAG